MRRGYLCRTGGRVRRLCRSAGLQPQGKWRRHAKGDSSTPDVSDSRWQRFCLPGVNGNDDPSPHIDGTAHVRAPQVVITVLIIVVVVVVAKASRIALALPE